MENLALAQKLVARFNRLCADPEIRKAIHQVLQLRIKANEAVKDHPTIQVYEGAVGFLGVLNGAIGTQEGSAWGFIAAEWKGPISENTFKGFVILEDAPKLKEGSTSVEPSSKA